jgi:hypothetical protein
MMINDDLMHKERKKKKKKAEPTVLFGWLVTRFCSLICTYYGSDVSLSAFHSLVNRFCKQVKKWKKRERKRRKSPIHESRHPGKKGKRLGMFGKSA